MIGVRGAWVLDYHGSFPRKVLYLLTPRIQFSLSVTWEENVPFLPGSIPVVLQLAQPSFLRQNFAVLKSNPNISHRGSGTRKVAKFSPEHKLEFGHLDQFSRELGTVFSGTAFVESDFSALQFKKDYHFTNMSNFISSKVLFGVSKQRKS